MYGVNSFDTKKVYKIVDSFLKGTKDIKNLLDYLKKESFPIEYIKYFEQNL